MYVETPPTRKKKDAGKLSLGLHGLVVPCLAPSPVVHISAMIPANCPQFDTISPNCHAPRSLAGGRWGAPAHRRPSIDLRGVAKANGGDGPLVPAQAGTQSRFPPALGRAVRNYP